MSHDDKHEATPRKLDVYRLILPTFLLLAASTVGLGVLGFALKHPILDAFSGIVLTVQKPFQTGD